LVDQFYPIWTTASILIREGWATKERAIFQAAGHALRAVNYLHELKPQAEEFGRAA